MKYDQTPVPNNKTGFGVLKEIAKLYNQSVNHKGVQKLPGHIWIASANNSKSENNSTSQTDKSPADYSLANPIITDT